MSPATPFCDISTRNTLVSCRRTMWSSSKWYGVNTAPSTSGALAHITARSVDSFQHRRRYNRPYHMRTRKHAVISHYRRVCYRSLMQQHSGVMTSQQPMHMQMLMLSLTRTCKQHSKHPSLNTTNTMSNSSDCSNSLRQVMVHPAKLSISWVTETACIDACASYGAIQSHNITHSANKQPTTS